MADSGKNSDLDDLWKRHVFDAVGRTETTTEGRQQAALEALRLRRAEYEQALSEDDPMRAGLSRNEGNAVWALLSVEAAGWLNKVSRYAGHPSFDDEAYWSGPEMSQLALWIHLHRIELVISATHRKGLDPIPLNLPAWLFKRLQNAISALPYGEVHTIVARAKTGRHTQPWTWDQFRIRAVEHVQFLVGQGVKKGAAQERVGSATGVSAKTLKDWEADHTRRDYGLKWRFKCSRRAGQMQAFASATNTDPKTSRRDHYLPDEVAAYDAFQEQPLAEFGRLYREKRRRRHNQ